MSTGCLASIVYHSLCLLCQLQIKSEVKTKYNWITFNMWKQSAGQLRSTCNLQREITLVFPVQTTCPLRTDLLYGVGLTRGCGGTSAGLGLLATSPNTTNCPSKRLLKPQLAQCPSVPPDTRLHRCDQLRLWQTNEHNYQTPQERLEWFVIWNAICKSGEALS